MKPILYYTTFATLEDGRKITDQLITEGLAGCVNLLAGMESSYMWEGKLEHSQEVATIIKTSSSLADVCMERLAELHPYEVPCILSIPIETGHAPYISWLLGQCAGGK